MTAHPVLDGDGPVYRQIRRAVARPILAGQWKPGERVPSEHELMELFGASRMTVHRALAALAEEGLIVRRRRLGSFVARRPAERSVLEIWDIGAEIARAGQSYRFDLLSRRVEAAGDELEALFGVARDTPVLDLAGLHYADDAPVQVERRLVNLAAAPDAAEADFSRVPPGRWLLDNVPWSDAEHVIRAAGAEPPEAGLLDIVPGAACLVVERRTWADGVPITFAELVNPGESRRLVGRFSPSG